METLKYQKPRDYLPQGKEKNRKRTAGIAVEKVGKGRKGENAEL